MGQVKNPRDGAYSTLYYTNFQRNLEGHVGDVYTCGFFPSGIVILSAGADMMVKIWSAETGACATTITGHKAGILTYLLTYLLPLLS